MPAAHRRCVHSDGDRRASSPQLIALQALLARRPPYHPSMVCRGRSVPPPQGQRSIFHPPANRAAAAVRLFQPPADQQVSMSVQIRIVLDNLNYQSLNRPPVVLIFTVSRFAHTSAPRQSTGHTRHITGVSLVEELGTPTTESTTHQRRRAR